MEETIQNQSGPDQDELYIRLVSRVFQIEAITYGNHNPKKPYPLVYNPANGAPVEYLARYSGRLIEDSELSFDRLRTYLAPIHTLPLFRVEEKQQVIYLISDLALPHNNRSNPWINLLLFLLTVLSVIFVGGINTLDNQSNDFLQSILGVISEGWPFAASLLSILVVHEFGHYFAGKLHGLDVTLPYFIPFPMPPIGTMGAFINLRDIPKNRNALLDVGISGPLAGLVTTLVVLWIGLKTSMLSILPSFNPDSLANIQLEGNSILYLVMKYLVFGKLLPEPTSYHGVNQIFYWVQYFFTGQPIPLGGTDVTINGIAFAGWCGLLVTSLNLIPAGQLDGGHVSSLIFGRKWMRRLFPILLVVTVILGFFWPGWLLWSILIFLFGRGYAEPLDQITPLSRRRRWLSYLTILVFLITFIPVPFNYF